MKQQVDISLTLSLWIDTTSSRFAITRMVRSRLLKAFRKEAEPMLDPVRIQRLREEAEIYGTEPTGLPTRFDDYEIHGVRKFGKGRLKHSEQVPDDQARFWSLFGHIPGQGLDCIGDFETRQHAEEVYARVTGRRYGSPT